MQSTQVSVDRPVFIRDRFTWIAYILLGYFAYLQSLQGPIMPFLRAELGLSYVVGSLHLSAGAACMVIIGLIGDRLLRRLGARTTLWGGALGIAAGAILLVLGRHVVITIAATASMGLLGTLLLIAQQSSLAHHQSNARAIAFTEANIVASLCTMLAPLAVGTAEGSGVGWRVALLLPLPLLAILLLREGREPVPESIHHQSTAANQRLPRRFWAFWAVACLGVAGEWSVGFWGTDYLHTVVDFPLELAVTTLSVFFVAILLGRIAGSRLARRFAPDRLLSGALILGILGVTLLWQAPNAAPSLVGLALAGLGIGNLYPLALAVAVESAPGQISAASVRMTLAGGVAIFSAPLLLGSWADRVGLQSAFALVPIFLATALILTVATTMRGASQV